jgi:amidophosphoribosyltransferase
VKLKLNPIPDAVRGKRLVVIDDSIVRGITTRQVIQILREAGASEVHMRITSPPIQWPCFYGIDMSTRQELLASDLSVEQVRQFIGADSLSYLSLDALVEATGAPKNDFCRACFDGKYPIPIPEREPTKLLLEKSFHVENS